MNLVDLIKGQLTGGMLDKVAGLLGTDTGKARSALDAGVPAVLAGLLNLSSSPDGARTLASAVNSADAGLVNNLGSVLGGSGQRGLLDAGAGMVNSLFGGNMLRGLSGAISKFTGLGETAVSSLLGLLTPLIMSVLKGRSQAMGGMDAGGIANLLAGQKQNIMGALPSGLGSLLSSIPGFSALSGVRDAVGSAAGSVGSAANQGYQTGRAAASRATNTAAAASARGMRWLVPVLALLAIAAIVYFLTRGTPAPTRALSPAPVVQNAGDTILRLTGDTRSFLTSTTETLATLRDASGVTAALPKLRELASKLDGIQSATVNLPAASRSTITKLFGDAAPTLTATIDRILAFPGLSEEARGVLASIAQKVRSLVTA